MVLGSGWILRLGSRKKKIVKARKKKRMAEMAKSFRYRVMDRGRRRRRRMGRLSIAIIGLL